MIKDLLKQENVVLKQIINVHKNLKNDIILIIRGGFYVWDKDVYYFNKAEKCLYNEFSLILNKSFDETKDYVVRYIQEKISES